MYKSSDYPIKKSRKIFEFNKFTYLCLPKKMSGYVCAGKVLYFLDLETDYRELAQSLTIAGIVGVERMRVS